MLRIILLSICISHTILEMDAVTVKSGKSKRLKDSKISRIQPTVMQIAEDGRHAHWGDNYEHKHHQMMAAKPETYNKEVMSRGEGKSISNSQLLDKLGLSKLHVPLSHNRKRLAVESRHRGRPDDSHMFVIKLPPNPYYYGSDKPMGHGPNSIDDYSRKIPVGFKSNGKPGRIYHWNIPVIKKMFSSTQSRNPNSRHTENDISEFYDIKNVPTWSSKSTWENDSPLKSHHSKKDEEKIIKKKSPSYYAPKQRKSAAGSGSKYFPGNGKPQSFYVIEKSHKPAYYQKLIP